eukprot:10357280-Alexandrium_andersonii.AAC.2
MVLWRRGLRGTVRVAGVEGAPANAGREMLGACLRTAYGEKCAMRHRPVESDSASGVCAPSPEPIYAKGLVGEGGVHTCALRVRVLEVA